MGRFLLFATLAFLSLVLIENTNISTIPDVNSTNTGNLSPVTTSKNSKDFTKNIHDIPVSIITTMTDPTLRPGSSNSTQVTHFINITTSQSKKTPVSQQTSRHTSAKGPTDKPHGGTSHLVGSCSLLLVSISTMIHIM
ncbi:hypothetical protein UPYG_G00340370 [Umbra pygmaea]|uniref:Uncharacterized protein n=1 Tax=Umbra pygmaea TaxID=75934 RepID=A0ABD0WFG9_UMBPY